MMPNDVNNQEVMLNNASNNTTTEDKIDTATESELLNCNIENKPNKNRTIIVTCVISFWISLFWLASIVIAWNIASSKCLFHCDEEHSMKYYQMNEELNGMRREMYSSQVDLRSKIRELEQENENLKTEMRFSTIKKDSLSNDILNHNN